MPILLREPMFYEDLNRRLGVRAKRRGSLEWWMKQAKVHFLRLTQIRGSCDYGTACDLPPQLLAKKAVTAIATAVC
jgi:hypothetical protein